VCIRPVYCFYSASSMCEIGLLLLQLAEFEGFA
jgi:hypothetical protein